MSHLVALVFDDPYKADEARAVLLRLAGEKQLELRETAVISKHTDGKMRMSQDADIVERDQSIGHIAGLVTAAITGTVPFILAGTLAGRLVGKFTDHGITNAFIKDVKKEVQPGTSCLMVFGTSDSQHRATIVEHLRTFNPRMIESDLPAELQADLDQELAAERNR